MSSGNNENNQEMKRYCFVNIKFDINHDQKSIIWKEFTFADSPFTTYSIKEIVNELIAIYNEKNANKEDKIYLHQVDVRVISFDVYNNWRFCVQNQEHFFIFRFNSLKLAFQR